MPRVKPPYPGQGLPLPESMGLKGAWIIENIVALVIDERFVPDENGTFVHAPKSPKGNGVFTFDAKTVAQSVDLTVEKLFEENRAGRLFVGFTLTSDTTATFKFFCNGIEFTVDTTRFTAQ